MPDSITLAVMAALALPLFLQLLLKVHAIRHLRQPQSPLLEGAECPPALVILCLRGGDPFLHRSLGLLIDQDYPRYRIRIVVDSPDDEAHQYLKKVFGESPPAHVEILTLTERHSTCTYKMSGILFGSQNLPEGTACVAFMDGDTVPHRTWLRELATPIVRDGAGVSTGNRWYAPQQLSLGSLCRVWWGASALSLMTWFRIPWGGTMAVRSDLLRDEELRTRLRHAYSEDTTIGQFAADRGERIEFPPTLVILNREVIGMRSLFQFDVRQMFAVRLTHQCWPLMALHGVVSGLTLTYPLWRLCGLPVSGMADVAFAVFIFAWGTIELVQMVSIRQILATRGDRLAGWSEPLRWFYALLALIVLPCLHMAAVLHAATLRRIYWRGVWYRIGGQPPLRVERDEWMPAAKT